MWLFQNLISLTLHTKYLTARISPCKLSVSVGWGNARLPRFYYSTAMNLCVPFTYSGLGGNENNFLTAQECTLVCLQVRDDPGLLF